MAKRGELHYAAAKGDVNTVIQLLESKTASVDELDYDKRTALHVAAANGHISTMEALAARGAKLGAEDRWGRTALDEAMNGHHPDAINFLRTRGANAKPQAALMKKQVSFQQIDPTSNLAMLFAAIVDDDINTVRSLLDNNRVDPNTPDDDKRTAAHIAASDGHLEILKYLVSKNINVNLKDRMGNRPLNDAMRGEHKECVDYLISVGGIASGEQGYDTDEEGAQSPKMFTLKHVSKEALNELHQRGVREFWSWDRSDFDMESQPFGKGAGGEVFKARFREMEIVAKTLGKLAVTQEQITDLANEIALMASIRHPHIVSFYGACFQMSPPVMLLEYCAGGNLESRILKAYAPDSTKYRLSGRQKLKYTHQIALAMTFLHRFHVPITHRDLKPGNILLTANDDIKITDFGLAKFTPQKDSDGPYNMTGETGSYRFMAPEVFEHRPYDRKVDVYAFAMIIYWLYMGVRPFVHQKEGVDAVRESVKKKRPIINIKESKIEGLIKQCWDHDPDHRPEFSAIARQCEEMKITGQGKRTSRIFTALGLDDGEPGLTISARSTESGSEGLPSPPASRRRSFFRSLFGWRS